MNRILLIASFALCMSPLCFAQNGSDITGGSWENPVRSQDDELELRLRRNRKDVQPALTEGMLAPIGVLNGNVRPLEDLKRSIGSLFAAPTKGPRSRPQDLFNAWSRALGELELASRGVVVYTRQSVPTGGQIAPDGLSRSIQWTQRLTAAAYTVVERTLDLLDNPEVQQSESAREKIRQTVLILDSTLESLTKLRAAQEAVVKDIREKIPAKTSG